MIKRNIPNLITLGNLLCGCLALIAIFAGKLDQAAYLVGIALILDFFDGFTARLLHVSSPIGKDLDSLADMVTFGLVPGMVMYQLISFYASIFIPYPNDIGGRPNYDTLVDLSNIAEYLKYFALLIPIMSAVRLAKFNNDSRQTESFIGLPTPANAMVICALPIILQAGTIFETGTFNGDLNYPEAIFIDPLLLCLSAIVLSFLLVAPIPLFALKFKSFAVKDNLLRYSFLALSLGLLIFLQVAAIPLIILLYILMSIVNNIFSKKPV